MNIVRTLGVAAVVAAAVLGGSGPAGAAGDTAPGTVTRPVLSAAEVAPFTAENYLGRSGAYAAPVPDPWLPGPILARARRPDLVVGSGGFATVQQAVNAAFRSGGTARRYIGILPGTYAGTVFIPAGGPPLTLYGLDARAADVRLEFRVDAVLTPAQWAALVNPSGQYVDGDPAWRMFLSCANRTSSTAGLCATVMWSQAPDLQLTNLTVTNTLLDSTDAGTHQGLALRTDADRQQIEGVRLIGRQDTFYANAGDPTRISRVLVRDSYVEGDTDFVFGNASALFEGDTFRVVTTRKPTNGVIFAPSTNPRYPYGFLVRGSRIVTDTGAPVGHLGRAWDQGAGAGYVPGASPNGQLVIRDSTIGAGFDQAAPWAPAATTGRPFSASTDPGRDLDDPTRNRLWEFGNTTT
jgi:pectinesterase